MNILLLGSGGREHALAKKIKESVYCDELYIAPGNAGTLQHGKNIDLSVVDFEAIAKFCFEFEIDLMVVGPEVPLVEGIVDYFREDHLVGDIKIVGPSSEGAMLEGSKAFAKRFMEKYDIPTAAYREFTADDQQDAIDYIMAQPLPVVLKADGLAAGKGVIIAQTHEEAITELKEMFSGKFGEASSRVVVEEFLKGIEFSAFVITDGNDYLMLPQAKDYKRIGEGDTGLNTGGMGAISPVPFIDDALEQQLIDQVIEPTIRGIREEGIDYKGFIFIGLMNVDGKLYVIEYNCRMGDPETEAIIPRIQSDILALFDSLFDGTLTSQQIVIDPQYATTVIVVSGGYPEAYQKGKRIKRLNKVKNSFVFHAGTTEDEFGDVFTSGGRVLAITSMDPEMETALATSMKNAEIVDFDGKYFRRDIGFDLK